MHKLISGVKFWINFQSNIPKRKRKFQISQFCILILSILINNVKATDIDTLKMFALVGFATVDYEITGGNNGSELTVTNYSQLSTYAKASPSYIIKVSGTITGSGMMEVAGNKTIVGLGDSALISGFGFNIKEVSNVIVRNLSFTGASDDAINIQTSEYVWVDHCDFSNGYDGLVDIKRGANFITVSWNKFSNHVKTCLLGHSNSNGDQDIGKLKVTYHHNWFNRTDQRHPRVRFAECHVYNNYYFNLGTYGVASCCDAEVLVESNYFKIVGYPVVTGGVLGIESPPGYVNNINNYFDNSGDPTESGTVFDPKTYYDYEPDTAENIMNIVTANAGVGILSDPVEFINYSYYTGIQKEISEESLFMKVYPNPVTEYTNISFYLPESNHVNINLYDITGKKIKVLADNYYNSGVKKILFQREKLGSGIYLLRFESGKFTDIKKLVVK